MSDQLSLMGFDAPARPTDRLFFAVFPAPDAAGRIAQLAQTLRDNHGLQGHALKTERFHITLHHVGDHVGLPNDVVRAACQALDTVTLPPFEVSFDRVASFSGNPSKRPFVLRGDDAQLAALNACQQALGVAMKRAGLGRWVDARFTPHVTLLYDTRLMPEQAVEPVSWRADRIVLVHSLLGQTRHVPLHTWMLRA